MLLFSFIFNSKMATQNSPSWGRFIYFKKHADGTAVIIQSNKTALNEVKDN